MKLESSLRGQIGWPTFLSAFDPEVHAQLTDNHERADADYSVLLQVLALDSSRVGHVMGLIIGPGCRYKTPEEIDGCALGETPSNFHYPVHLCPTPAKLARDFEQLPDPADVIPAEANLPYGPFRLSRAIHRPHVVAIQRRLLDKTYTSVGRYPSVADALRDLHTQHAGHFPRWPEVE